MLREIWNSQGGEYYYELFRYFHTRRRVIWYRCATLSVIPAESKLLHYEPVAVYPSSSSVSIHQTARHHIQKDHNLPLKSDHYLCVIYKYYSVLVRTIGTSYSVVFEIALFAQTKVKIFGFTHADRCI